MKDNLKIYFVVYIILGLVLWAVLEELTYLLKKGRLVIVYHPDSDTYTDTPIKTIDGKCTVKERDNNGVCEKTRES